MSITLTEIITIEEYLSVFPQDESVEENAILSAINRATITLDGICGGMIAKVWPISKPDDPAYDPTSEFYRTTTEIGYIKQAVALQAQYNVSRNLDFTAGSENYSSGSNNYNETRSRPELVADETIYQLLAQARVYNPNITTDTTIANNGNLSGFYNPAYDPLENYVTYNVGDLRYVFKHNSLGANKYLKYDENGNIITDTISVSPTGTSSAIANFITIGGSEYQIGGSGGGGSPNQYLQTASVSGNTLTITEINGSSPTPITYTPTGLVQIPGLEAISHLPYNFAYHFAMTPTANSINGTIYTLTLDNNKTVRTWPISIPGATSSTAGVMTASDKQTLSTRAEDFSVDGTTIKWKSGATRTLESGIPSAVHFKGVVASTTDLPASPSEGDLYYVGTTTPYNIYIYNGSGWIAAGTSSTDLSKVVTTDTDQEISGSKTFQGTTKIDKHGTFTIDNDATWSNSTTTISSSSTDKQWPTAKAVYDYVGDYLKTITGYDASKIQKLYNNKGSILWSDTEPTPPIDPLDPTAWDSGVNADKWTQDFFDSVQTLNDTQLATLVGKTRQVEVNGVKHTVRVIGYNHDDLSSGTGKAKLTFEFSNLITSGTSAVTSKYAASNNRSFPTDTLNTYLSGTAFGLLPTILQTNIKEVSKPVAQTSSYTVTNYNAKLFPMSVTEIGQSASYAAVEGTAYAYYSTHTSVSDRIKYPVGSTSGTDYWLRSPGTNYSNYAFYINYTGNIDDNGVGGSCGVAPCFCI